MTELMIDGSTSYRQNDEDDKKITMIEDGDDESDDNDDVFNLFFSYGKGGRCSSHCPGSSMGCAPR